MAPTGTQFLHGIAERGIPAQWREFGSRMSADGAIVTHLVSAVQEAYETGSAETRDAALRLFGEKRDNLAAARQLIATQLAEYHESGRWARLNAVARAASVEELIEGMRPHFGLHPYPIVLESVRFNFEYVREHGFEEFYRMTDRYLVEIERLTEEGRAAFIAGEDGESFPPFWLYTLDMASVEVPAHCHICQNLITYAERALDES